MRCEGTRRQIFIENINDNKHTFCHFFLNESDEFFNRETVLYVSHVESLELKQTVSR